MQSITNQSSNFYSKMKKVIFILAIGALSLGCKNEKTNAEIASETEVEAVNYHTYGDEISGNEVLTQSEMAQKFQNLKPGDTLNVKFSSEVKEVCQKKGCWMKLNMGEEVAMVRFKDYGFFMPKDISGQTIIVGGKAYVEEMSVEDQKHYAEDGGKTPEEIAAITEPKRTLAFEAKGVLIPEEVKQ